MAYLLIYCRYLRGAVQKHLLGTSTFTCIQMQRLFICELPTRSKGTTPTRGSPTQDDAPDSPEAATFAEVEAGDWHATYQFIFACFGILCCLYFLCLTILGCLSLCVGCLILTNLCRVFLTPVNLDTKPFRRLGDLAKIHSQPASHHPKVHQAASAGPTSTHHTPPF